MRRWIASLLLGGLSYAVIAGENKGPSPYFDLENGFKSEARLYPNIKKVRPSIAYKNAGNDKQYILFAYDPHDKSQTKKVGGTMLITEAIVDQKTKEIVAYRRSDGEFIIRGAAAKEYFKTLVNETNAQPKQRVDATESFLTLAAVPGNRDILENEMHFTNSSEPLLGTSKQCQGLQDDVKRLRKELETLTKKRNEAVGKVLNAVSEEDLKPHSDTNREGH